MNNNEKPNLIIHFRFALAVILSIAVIFVDVRTKLLNDFRYYLETVLYPVLVFADSPHSLSRLVSSQLKSHSELIEENERLSAENYLQRAAIQRLQSLEIENAAMRKMLNSPQHVSSKRLFGEVIDIDSNPFLKRLVVNRGKQSGVYEGMPVISDNGLIGQVISVNYAYSRVLLITDPNCSVPVIDNRSSLRAIATGTGSQDEILINNVPRSTDVRVGDKFFTSGLGGVYPEGYPVAEVTSIGYSETQPFALIKAKPTVDLDKIRYVLMYWYDDLGNDEEKKVIPKEPTDGKIILRQQRIKNIIESLSKHNDANAVSPNHTDNNQGALSNNVNQ